MSAAADKYRVVPYQPDASADRSIAFITKPKCGSQWVRNVMLDPRLQSDLGIFSVVDTSKVQGEDFPQVEPATFYGPCYGTTRRQWQRFRRPADQALFVIRDPRDLVISWLHSVLFSHRPDEFVDAARGELLDADPQRRLEIGIHWAATMQEGTMTFFLEQDPGILCVRYEDLVADDVGQFEKIFGFLGYSGPRGKLEEVIAENRFSARSGRKRGQEDVFSHHRKGSPGEWRSYFSRETGQYFEGKAPGFVATTGYESSDRWWQTLPEYPELTVANPKIDFRDHARLKQENENLRQRCRSLEAQLATLKKETDARASWIRKLIGLPTAAASGRKENR